MGRLVPDSALWEITDSVAQRTEMESLSKAEARQHALTLMAARWDVPVEEITAEDDATLYTLLSKIMRLVFPVSAFAAANLARERAGGALGFNDALELARGNAVSLAELEARRQPRNTSSQSRGLAFASILRAVIVEARAAGYSDTEISALVEDIIAGDATA